MWSRRPVRAAALLVAGLLVVVGTGAAVASPSGGPATGATERPSPPAPTGVVDIGGGRPVAQTQSDRPDPATVVRVNLTSEGDARWTVTSRFTLDGESDRAGFRRFVADLRNGTDPEPRVGYSPETFRRLADRVARATDRSGMSITDTSWDGTVRDDVGVVSLSFTWTDFARVDGDRVLLDDVFHADVGLVSSLSSDQRLVIAPPPGYAVSDTPFPTEDGTIQVDGAEDVPEDVTSGDASVVYVSRTLGPGGVPAWLLVGGLVVTVGAAVGAASLYVRRRDADPVDPTVERADPESDPASDAESTADDTATVTEEPVPEVDEELLSDEERVERLLARNGGRMKQATIVSETGWSNAKVSQLLSSMDEAGRVDKLRIGRENLISLPDETVVDLDADPDDADGTDRD